MMLESNQDTSAKASPDAGTRCLAWARRELGVDPDTPLDTICQVFWARLERDGMLPPRSVAAALEHLRLAALGVSDGALPQEFLLAEQVRLTHEVETFARGMFRMPIPVRQTRWDELYQQCELLPEVRARLTALKPGLRLDWQPNEAADRETAQLTTAIGELFVATFSERPACRRRVREWWDYAEKRRCAAVRRFDRHFPGFVSLVPDMISELQEPPSTRQKIRNWQEHLPSRLVGATTRRDNNAGSWGCLLLFTLLALLIGTMAVMTAGAWVPYWGEVFRSMLPKW